MSNAVTSGQAKSKYPRKRVRSGIEKGPMITIITVVLNGAQYLKQSVKSVKDLSYGNIEYIVIDGGSSDETVDILKENDSFIDYWVSEPDRGVYDAMNKAVDIARGDYLLFLGADDYLYDVIHEIVDRFNDDHACYYGDVLLSGSNRRYDGNFCALKLLVRNIPHQAIFYSKYVFDAYRYDMKYRAVADYAMNLKLFADDRFPFKYIPKTVANYNNVDGLSSRYTDDVFSTDKSRIVRDHYSLSIYCLYVFLRFIQRVKMIFNRQN